MLLFFSDDHIGNASSIHQIGRISKEAISKAREAIARGFDFTSGEEICFTGGGTEASNMAIKGAFFRAQADARRFHLIINQTEHEATLQSADFVEGLGARVHRLPVSGTGIYDLALLERLLRDLSQDKNNQVMVSQMGANNETGILFDYCAIGGLVKEAGGPGAIYHLDASQLPGKVKDFSIAKSHADLVTLSAHKFGGPKGIGALYVKKGVKLISLLHGGAQERKRRAGTENVAAIVGFGKAVEELATRNIDAIAAVRDYLDDQVLAKIDDVTLLGRDSETGKTQPRIANTSNFVIKGCAGDSLIMNLDLAGFAVSSGSACHSGSINPSHVLLAMGFDDEQAQSGLRVSLGPDNTMAEIDQFVAALAESVERIRSRPKSRFSDLKKR